MRAVAALFAVLTAALLLAIPIVLIDLIVGGIGLVEFIEAEFGFVIALVVVVVVGRRLLTYDRKPGD